MEIHPLGYITYVFYSLDESQKSLLKSNYLMCVRFPNWDHRQLEIGEIGFLNYIEIKAGIDTWFDGKNFIPYNNTNIQFIKFIKEKSMDSSHIITD